MFDLQSVSTVIFLFISTTNSINFTEAAIRYCSLSIPHPRPLSLLQGSSLSLLAISPPFPLISPVVTRPDLPSLIFLV